MTKKIIVFFMAALLIFQLAACGNMGQKTQNAEKQSPPSDAEGMDASDTEASAESAGATESEGKVANGKTLVVYFSWSTSGNTRKMAEYIQEQTGGDILELVPANPYPTDYNETGDVAKAERDENARPEIAGLPDSISEYDTIFVGYPIWWHTAPMIIGTFLENYDLTGVDIYPFSQSASMDTEQFDNSMDFVRENAKGADVHDGLFAEADDTDGIMDYLTANGFIQNSMGSNILIAYFTVPETDGIDTVASASRVATADGVMGNTEFIASEIQKNLGGDLFRIETVQEYPGTHNALLESAYNEKSDNARPELSSHIDNLDSYDYIFVGYPNWNADLPMPLYSFFDEYDFSGKTIIPFVTHGGSGFSGTVQTIQKLEPDATVIEAGLSVSRNSVSNAQDDVKKWTDSIIKN